MTSQTLLLLCSVLRSTAVGSAAGADGPPPGPGLTAVGGSDAPVAGDAAPERAAPIDDAPGAGQPAGGAPSPAGNEQGSDSDMDFDLLGAPPPPPPTSSASTLKARRAMLTVHQGLGIGLLSIMAGTMVTGQLNYNDRFLGPSSARYERVHGVLAYTAAGAFAATGLLAVLAPVPAERTATGFGRVKIHAIGMTGATLGMLAQGTLGIFSTRSEGRLVQRDLALAHLIVGYTTLAFMGAAVGALVL